MENSILIIGSGLGGLVSGAILSKKGHKVTVLEKHWVAGGCLQDFMRKGTSFNTGMHYIGSYEKDQVLYKIFNYLGIADQLEVNRLDEEGFDIFNINGKIYKYGMGQKSFAKKLKADFPQEEKAIDTYLAKINEITDKIDLFNLRELEINPLDSHESQEISAFDYISSVTKNKELAQVLSALNFLYGGKKSESSLFMHAVINRFFIDSAYRIERGGDIAKELTKVICANGGDVKLKSEVVKINVEDKIFTSLELKNGEILKADYCISNTHPALTVEMCTAGFKKSYKRRIAAMEQTISSFSVYIRLKDKVVRHNNSNYYYTKNDDIWMVDNCISEDWPQGFMLYTTEDKNNPTFAKSVTIIAPMQYSDVSEWEDTSIEKRGEEYKRFKQEKAEALLQVVDITFPEIKNNIEDLYTASPLTYRDYTGTLGGSMYGVFRSCKSPMASMILPDTSIKNLFFTGQNTNIHGILGVCLGSMLTAGRLTDINTLIKDIKANY